MTKDELERYAMQIAHPDFDIETATDIKALIGPLDFPDRDAVLARAAEIVRSRAKTLSGATRRLGQRLGHPRTVPSPNVQRRNRDDARL